MTLESVQSFWFLTFKFVQSFWISGRNENVQSFWTSSFFVDFEIVQSFLTSFKVFSNRSKFIAFKVFEVHCKGFLKARESKEHKNLQLYKYKLCYSACIASIWPIAFRKWLVSIQKSDKEEWKVKSFYSKATSWNSAIQ